MGLPDWRYFFGEKLPWSFSCGREAYKKTQPLHFQNIFGWKTIWDLIPMDTQLRSRGRHFAKCLSFGRGIPPEFVLTMFVFCFSCGGLSMIKTVMSANKRGVMAIF